MANLGCLFVCTFGNYHAPVLIAVHTYNNLDFSDEPEDKKSNRKIVEGGRQGYKQRCILC